MTIVRTTLSRDLYETASAKAFAEGTTLAAVLRAAIENYVAEPSAEPVKAVPRKDWSAMRDWIKDNTSVLSSYPGPRPPYDTPALQRDFYAWALKNGFEPD